MAQRAQPRHRALQHRDPQRPQPRSRGLVHRRRQVRQDGDRLVGPRQQPLQRLRERLVAVVLLHQVHRQRHGSDLGVVGQRRQRVAEQVLRVGPAAPDVERVGRLQPGVEQRREPRDRRRRQIGERYAEPLGHVGHQHPLGARVVHGGQPTSAAVNRPPGDREQLEAVGQLGQVEAAVYAVRREQRLPARVRARDRPGVRVHQRLPAHRGADRQCDHRDVARGRLRQRGLQTRGVAHRLQHQPDHPRLRQRERVGEVIGRGADQLLSRRHHDRVLQSPVGAQHGREDRARVRHQRDRPHRQRVALEVADRPHPGGEVDEAHAAATDHRHLARRRDHLVLDAVRRAVDDRAGVTASGRRGERRRERGVRDPQQHQVHRLRYVVQGRHAGVPQHRRATGVHQMHAGEPRAAQHLGRDPPAERVRALAGAHHGHRARAHHRPQTGWRFGRHRPRRPSTRRGERRADLASASAAFAACMPGMPQTPPPAWVADDAL